MTGRWWTFVPSGLAIALVAYAWPHHAGVDEATNPRLRRAASGRLARAGPRLHRSSRTAVCGPSLSLSYISRT